MKALPEMSPLTTKSLSALTLQQREVKSESFATADRVSHSSLSNESTIRCRIYGYLRSNLSHQLLRTALI
jgi:hypothetical protein